MAKTEENNNNVNYCDLPALMKARGLDGSNHAEVFGNSSALLCAGSCSPTERVELSRKILDLMTARKQLAVDSVQNCLNGNNMPDYFKNYPQYIKDEYIKDVRKDIMGKDDSFFMTADEAKLLTKADVGSGQAFSEQLGHILSDGKNSEWLANSRRRKFQISYDDAKLLIDMKRIANAKLNPNTVPLSNAVGGSLIAMRNAGNMSPVWASSLNPKIAGPLIADGDAAALQSSQKVLGEPVSVANGEYLETWRDFLIPGVLSFDGSRYMGLKLPDAERWQNPLGPCQISAFDEYLSNPKRGELVFHQADGKAIGFERPFNFLPSKNAANPHLELKAPWLGQLRLKDRNIYKFFKQYDDTFYRLIKVEDLNGNCLIFHRDDSGVLLRIERSDGLKLVFDNDAQGRRTGITLIGVEGSKLPLARYTYDARSRMMTAQCAFGMSVRYEWHARKPLLHRWHNTTKRSETVFTYDDDGRVVHTATSGLWNDDRFVYDSDKRETLYLPEGDEARAQKFAYDSHENITAEVDALGGVVAHRYNKAGFRTATIDANGHEAKTIYDIFGNVKKFTDAEGRRTTYGWGPDGQLDIVIDNLGNKTQYKHDENSNVILEIDAEGQKTAFERDARGRVVRTVFANGAEEKRIYGTDFGWLNAVIDAKSGMTRFTYDPFGRVVETINPLGQKTEFEYAAGAGGFDVPTALRRPDGVIVRRAFDQEGALASVTDGEGREWRYRHGAFDVLEAIEDPRGGVLKLGYDSEGNLTSVTNAMGRVYTLRRDAAARIIAEEDFDGRVTHYKRDAGGRVVERIKPDGVRLTYAYDKTGLVTRIEAYEVDAQKPSEVVRYWYDGRGLLETAQNSAATINYIRDKCGRVIEEDCNGRRIKVRYDACGRRVSRRVFSGIDQPNEMKLAEHLVTYVRDPLGAIERLVLNEHEPLNFKRDALGRETRRESAGGFKLDSSYDAAGQLLHQEAGRSLGHTYEDMHRAQMMGLRPDVVRQVDRSYGWDKAFAPTSIKDGIWGETRFSYDRNGQVSEARFGADEGESFAYDAARNIAGVRAVNPDAGGRGDRLGTLLNWTSTPGGAVQVAKGPKGETITLHHDSCGRVIERLVERDGFRPKRWRYEWDAFDRLTLCVTPEHERWVYGYDAFGRRISKVRKFTEPELVWLQQKHPRALEGRQLPVDRGAWQTQPQRPKNVAAIDGRPPIVGMYYTWDGDVLCEEAPLRLDGKVEWILANRWHFEEETFKPLAKEDSGGELSYIVTDHLGTPREMFSESGFLQWAASFTTWGVIRGVKVPVPEAANDDNVLIYNGRPKSNIAFKFATEESIYDCPIRFQGQWQDEETGLYYNRHRYYDPLTAQYMSPDPIGLKGGERPQGYVAIPTIYIDIFGLNVTMYRGTDFGIEINIQKETGQVLSQAGQTAYMNARYSGATIEQALAQAMKASKKSFSYYIKVLGNVRNYIKEHGKRGTDLKNKPGMSWTTDEDIAKKFGDTIFKTTVPKNSVFPQILETSTEKESIIFHSVPAIGP